MTTSTALRFYQRRGFFLAAVHGGAVDDSRSRLKPEIPWHGAYGIPLRDEISNSKNDPERQLRLLLKTELMPREQACCLQISCTPGIPEVPDVVAGGDDSGQRDQ